MEQPLVSILLPIHNAAKTIRLCMESLLSQSYTNIEIIAVDDASTDDSYHIVKEIAKNDHRIRATRNTKRYGLTVCLNRAIKQARGTHIAFMDPYDISHKDRIKNQVEFLSQNQKVIVVGTQCHFLFPKSGERRYSSFPTDHWGVYEMLFSGLSIQPETAMINRTRIPRDMLRFDGTSYRFLPVDRRIIYTRSFMRLLPYGEFANLSDVLYSQRNPQGVESILTFIKLWINSFMHYDYRPSVKILFSSILKPTLRLL